MQDNNKIIKEACVETLDQAINAELNGADRIELCSDLANAGITPSYGLIKRCKQKLKIPIFVIIRPRPGNFIYNEEEIEIMKNDIEICSDLNIDGVVFGILNKENKIDIESIKYLMNLCKPKLKTTFHMAFDLVEDKEKAIDCLIELGFNRILTKGGEGQAIKNKSRIKELINYANNKIIIMPGGGLTKDNLQEFIKDINVKEVHGTKIV